MTWMFYNVPSFLSKKVTACYTNLTSSELGMSMRDPIPISWSQKQKIPNHGRDFPFIFLKAFPEITTFYFYKSH